MLLTELGHMANIALLKMEDFLKIFQITNVLLASFI